MKIINKKSIMSLGILGTKLGMTQIFDEAGFAIPVTVIKAGPCIVTQIKNVDKEGYNAIQIGYGQVPIKNINKPELGHLQKSNSPPLRHLKEYRLKSDSQLKVSDKITVNLFIVGQNVSVSGRSIGRGFAGTVKRHNFTRGPMSHGSKNHREPGSIGMGTSPGRVFPGKKMAGRLGGTKTTIKNLKVVHINNENGLLVVKGTIPGKIGNLLSIK
jgi:large subunit ribosomal protein L3